MVRLAGVLTLLLTLADKVAATTSLQCRRMDFTLVHVSKSDDNDCKTLCLAKKSEFLGWHLKHPDKCRYTNPCARINAISFDSVTTNCTCQMSVIVMRQRAPGRKFSVDYNGRTGGYPSEMVDPDSICSIEKVVKRLGLESGTGWTAISYNLDSDGVHCESQANNVWCNEDGIAHQGDQKLAYQLDPKDNL